MILLLLRTHKHNPVFGASAQRISRPSYTAVVALTATCKMTMCLWGGYHTFVFGSGTKLFEKVPGFIAGVPEFKTILKVPGFRFFFLIA